MSNPRSDSEQPALQPDSEPTSPAHQPEDKGKEPQYSPALLESPPGQDSSNPFDNAEPSAYGESSAAAAASALKKYRVRFNSNADANRPPWLASQPSERPQNSPERAIQTSPRHAPRPSVLRTPSSDTVPQVDTQTEPDPNSEKGISASAAQERARKIEKKVKEDRDELNSDDDDHRASFESARTATTSEGGGYEAGDIPMQDLGGHAFTRLPSSEAPQDTEKQRFGAHGSQAANLVRTFTTRMGSRAMGSEESEEPKKPDNGEGSSKTPATHENHGGYDGVYEVPPPQQYRGGVLSQLLKLNKQPLDYLPGGHGRNWSTSTLNNGEEHTARGREKGRAGDSRKSSRSRSAGESGAATPTFQKKSKWYNHQSKSSDTLGNLIMASNILANPNTTLNGDEMGSPGHKPHKGKHKRKGSGSANRLSAFMQKEEARITVHIAETLFRQDYIVKMCRALMLYGAPTHRLEEMLSMTARVLEIDSQFLYLPGCMIISFDDRSTHTTEVRIVRSAQGIDLGKLKDIHLVYKEVMHDLIGVEEGAERLDAIIKQADKFHVWFRVLVHGLTAVSAAPFSFKARLIDLPLIFCFGCLVGFLQLIVSAKNNLYSNVFEVSAVVVVSFMARAFGSIQGGNLFCFSALAQGGIVMLLPGYMVLCSSLEIQSRAIVPGSIRIVYAIIYSLLLGFGITVGASIWGLFDPNATSDTVCHDPMDPYLAFIFVPAFILCVSILYQAKWKQMPVMLVIAFAGYIVNFFSSRKFAAAPAIANTLGALAVGLLANLWSRVRHGVAAATLIPAIFTQVPGGLAASGGLVSGISTANMLTGSNSTSPQAGQDYNNTAVFNVAASMIQIAIGIAVGLFLSALIVYPFGKRRSGLFSF
ncbi:DUF1212 domain membrane protein Prm10 [Emericellopsis cladophorae]|uniref:DUF1212 domain membrane protein Prm10 n=1 Tax=Emericellopsis cladophorae TaxID=2686198 RepID=A0A9P9Y0P4_9HYPO|nr:DUF1212 domain membrane protein Prm10 [Emericellopsis cladophorae]KAI6781331.1 DUF1212 domain membrane protein Prm10 [Emericellopsis cladophorae]